MPEAKTKPEARKDAPTEAQLSQLAALVDELEAEVDAPVTADEAQAMIEHLQATVQARADEADADAEPDLEEEAEEEQAAAEEAQARSGAERSDKQTQQMFDRAMRTFGQSLAAVFGVEAVVPASTPGVVGYLLPGFTEQKTHEDFTRCQTCNGYGNVLTGSMKEGDKERPCPDPRCKGRGYWERQHTPPAPPPMPATAITGPTAYEQPAPNGDSEWGEAPAWMGDPRLAGPTQP